MFNLWLAFVALLLLFMCIDLHGTRKLLMRKSDEKAGERKSH